MAKTNRAKAGFAGRPESAVALEEQPESFRIELVEPLEEQADLAEPGEPEPEPPTEEPPVQRVVSEFELPARAFAFLLVGQVANRTISVAQAHEKVREYKMLRPENQRPTIGGVIQMALAEFSNRALMIHSGVTRE